MPQFELVVGPQPALPEVPPGQAQVRMQRALLQFVQVLARPEHPLVIFLDDLQWVDAGSLELLVRLCEHDRIGHLLVVGAYRDNEVTPAHPLAVEVDGLRRRARLPVTTLTLPPLSAAQLREIVAAVVGRAAPAVEGGGEGGSGVRGLAHVW